MLEESLSTTSRSASTSEEDSIDGEALDVTEPSDVTGDAGAAGALHRVLSMRQDVETQLAEAADTRRQALVEATVLLGDAQSVAAESAAAARSDAENTVAEARDLAAGIVAEAQAQADSILADARAQAEQTLSQAAEHGAQVQVEALAEAKSQVRRDYAGLQETLARLCTDVDARFATLQEALKLAELTVDDVSSQLGEPDEVVAGDASSGAVSAKGVADTESEDDTAETGPVEVAIELPVEGPETNADESHPETPEVRAEAREESRRAVMMSLVADDESEILDDDLEPSQADEAHVAHSDARSGDDGGARPLGWLFRSPQP